MPTPLPFPGLQFSRGIQPTNRGPVDAFIGPYTQGSGETLSGAVAIANASIEPILRYQSMMVSIIGSETVGGATSSYKYWYKDGTADSDLVVFSSGGGGGIVGDYVTTFNGLSGAVQGVSAAVAGDGITLSAATGSVTITNTGVTYIIAGSFIGISGATGSVTIINMGVHSFNGATGAVTGASLGANTFSELNTFSAGISASGGTLGSLVVNNGLSASGAITLNGTVSGSAASFSGLLTAIGGISADGVTASTLDVTNLAKFNGNVTIGDSATDVLTVTSGATLSGRVDVGGVLQAASGATFESTTDHTGVARFAAGITTSTLDVTNLARFASGISASAIYASTGSTFTGPVVFNGGLTASRVDVSGGGYVSSDFTVGGTLSVDGNLYVQGTVTTVNETQLLIQDKYLVLGSTLDTDALGVSAGVYIGSTTSPIISFAYNNNVKAWESSKSINVASGSTGYYIGETLVLSGNTLGTGVLYSSLTKVGTLVAGTWNASVIGLTYGGTNKDLSATGVSGGIVFKDGSGLSVLSSAGSAGQYLSSGGANSAPTWASFSALTGLTADSVSVTEVTTGTFYLPIISGYATSTYTVQADSGMTYDANTNTLSCTQIEAIVDGGTW